LRGLRLFVRPFERADDVEIRAFLDRQTEDVEARLSNFVWDATPAACGLLGKLLGDIVAVVALEITSDAMRIKNIVVARDLRKKWIGRVMMREVEQLAVKMDRRRLIVDDACGADEFFRRVGFRFEGERWVRVVASQ
jgi:N-acetylglutamate synthase-like GNAT family acetyltransferase